MWCSILCICNFCTGLKPSLDPPLSILTMASQLGQRVRLVKCPRCLKILREDEDVPVYQCGGCSAILRAKKRNIAPNSTPSVAETEKAQASEPQTNNVSTSSGQDTVLSSSTDRKVYLPPQHQVFISFRGEQLRYNFVSHLVGALRRKMINVFIDKQENKGEDISNLLKRIEESRIAIVVFSSKYTESTWCMREAETITERAAQGKLKVLPIFYKVNPMNVKQLKGEFGDNFRDREWEYRNDESLIKKWKEALAYIAGKIGFTLNDQSDENNTIASIVDDVMRMLTSIPLDTQTG